MARGWRSRAGTSPPLAGLPPYGVLTAQQPNSLLPLLPGKQPRQRPGSGHPWVSPATLPVHGSGAGSWVHAEHPRRPLALRPPRGTTGMGATRARCALGSPGPKSATSPCLQPRAEEEHKQLSVLGGSRVATALVGHITKRRLPKPGWLRNALPVRGGKQQPGTCAIKKEKELSAPNGAFSA